MHLHVVDLAGVVIDFDVFEAGDESDLVDGLVVLLHELVALGRTFVIVEGDAGADHVEHHRALVRDGGLEHGQQLLLVAGERAAHKRCAQLDGQRAGVDGRQFVDDAGLQLGADVGRGRELALGEAVHAVVLDDVDHRQIAAHQVNELAHADGGRVAVAGDAERHHGAVGQHCAGGD